MITADEIEERVKTLRRSLEDAPSLKVPFERRYRPDVERLQSCTVVREGGGIDRLLRFTVKGKVWDLVELMGDDLLTQRALVIDFQTQKVLQFPRYIEAEITMVDLMQEAAHAR